MKHTIEIPDDWTPEQALAACEVLYDVVSAICDIYHEPITELCQHEAMCDAVRELEEQYDNSLYNADDDDDNIPF
jgi:hypothetical protein